MKTAPRIFVDSDVVISSLISKKGAAFLLLQSRDLNFYLSDVSIKELNKVVRRMNLDNQQLTKLIKNNFKVVNLEQELPRIRERYQKYVTDINDAHIVAGAVISQAKFLVTYNQKDYLNDNLQSSFRIIVMTPGRFLQYRRSL